MKQPNDTLIARQLELEAEATALGALRYRRDIERKTGSETAPGRKLLSTCVDAVSAAITAYVEAAAQGGAGRRQNAVKWLKELPHDVCAYLAAKACVDAVTTQGGKGRHLVTVAGDIAKALERDINYGQLKKEAPGLHKVIQADVKKSTSARHAVAVMDHAVMRYLSDHFEFSEGDGVALGIKLAELFCETTGLTHISLLRVTATRTRYMLYATDTLTDWLGTAHARAELFSPYWLPMLVPPRAWAPGRQGGYLTEIAHLTPLVRTRNRGYHAELALADMPAVYKAVNAIQNTAWHINGSVLDVARDLWELGGDVAGLPARDSLPLPPRPPMLDSSPELFVAEHHDEFLAWKRETKLAHEAEARARSGRAETTTLLDLAERFRDEAAIYFPHTLDFRGRVYPVSTLLTPQGNDLSKGLLHFAEGMPLGEDGAFWLAVHVANVFGVDKVPFEERVSWVRANEDMILDSAVLPLDGMRAWADADSPFCALAACFEWLGFTMHGKDHVSRLPIALDGSCNGLQNFSAMLRDSVGGQATNLVPQKVPADIYTRVKDVAAERVAKEAEAGNALACFWDGRLTRGLVKQPVMTLPYGVTQSGIRAQVQTNAAKEGINATNEQCAYLATVLWECIGTVVIAARAAMDWLKSAAVVASKASEPIHWTTPAGFPALQEYRVEVGKRIRTHIDGKVVALMLAVTGTALDTRRQSLGISPNFVHACDASHLMLTTGIAADHGVVSFAMIHDSYGTHAANTSLMAAALREAFVQQYEQDVLASFRDELMSQLPPPLAKKIPPLPEKGDLDINAVLDSDYFFA